MPGVSDGAMCSHGGKNSPRRGNMQMPGGGMPGVWGRAGRPLWLEWSEWWWGGKRQEMGPER